MNNYLPTCLEINYLVIKNQNKQLVLFLILPVPPVVIQNDDWIWEELSHYLYEENAFDNIVISPGPGSPACPQDIGENMDVFVEFPLCIYFSRRCNRKISW